MLNYWTGAHCQQLVSKTHIAHAHMLRYAVPCRQCAPVSAQGPRALRVAHHCISSKGHEPPCSPQEIKCLQLKLPTLSKPLFKGFRPTCALPPSFCLPWPFLCDAACPYTFVHITFDSLFTLFHFISFVCFSFFFVFVFLLRLT